MVSVCLHELLVPPGLEASSPRGAAGVWRRRGRRAAAPIDAKALRSCEGEGLTTNQIQDVILSRGPL